MNGDRGIGGEASPKPVPEAVVQALLTIAALSVTGLLVCAWGWYRASTAPVTVGELSPEERQTLVQQMVAISPGEHRWAYFEPRIGYTLKPRAELSIYDDTFRSNLLGYRTGPPAKPPGTFRVAFVGDSWTYGMGIERAESFPEVVAALANEKAGQSQRIEAWTLALPGYNTFNQMAALWFHYHRLQPDAVVICPTANDNHSSATILPNGSPWRGGLLRDLFGDSHAVTYGTSRMDSFRFRERWRLAFEEIRRSEEKLGRLEVPVLLAFVARWGESQAHYWMREAGLRSPYLVVPLRLTMGEWRNPPPIDHGTAAANRLYARMVYKGLARLLDWRALPSEEEEGEVAVYTAVPAGDWSDAYARLMDAPTRRDIPESYHRKRAEAMQIAGPMGVHNSRMGRATTVLVYHRQGARHLEIALRRLPDRPQLYPLPLKLSIPSPSGGSEIRVSLRAEGPPLQTFELPIPEDIRPGAALDVVLEAGQTAAAAEVLRGHSLIVESIEQR